MYPNALLEKIYMADVIMIEAAHGEQGETIHGHTDPHSNTLNSEHMKCIVPDSFEYSMLSFQSTFLFSCLFVYVSLCIIRKILYGRCNNDRGCTWGTRDDTWAY